MSKLKLKFGMSARLGALAILAAVSVAPVLAESKMSGKMSSGKMSSGKMSGSGMMMSASEKKTMAGMSSAEKKIAGMPAGAKMSAGQKKTMAGMTASEKKLATKMMKMHAAKHGGKGMMATCPHCKVAMKGGKCPMCGMTAKQMKNKM